MKNLLTQNLLTLGLDNLLFSKPAPRISSGDALQQAAWVAVGGHLRAAMQRYEQTQEYQQAVARQPAAAQRRAAGGFMPGARGRGPLPPPADFAYYEQLVPGAAKRILRLAEDAAARQRDDESARLQERLGQVKRGQWLVFALACTGMAAAGCLALLGGAGAGVATVLFGGAAAGACMRRWGGAVK